MDTFKKFEVTFGGEDMDMPGEANLSDFNTFEEFKEHLKNTASNIMRKMEYSPKEMTSILGGFGMPTNTTTHWAGCLCSLNN